jgi:hypothetical protein
MERQGAGCAIVVTNLECTSTAMQDTQRLLLPVPAPARELEKHHSTAHKRAPATSTKEPVQRFSWCLQLLAHTHFITYRRRKKEEASNPHLESVKATLVSPDALTSLHGQRPMPQSSGDAWCCTPSNHARTHAPPPPEIPAFHRSPGSFHSGRDLSSPQPLVRAQPHA